MNQTIRNQTIRRNEVISKLLKEYPRNSHGIWMIYGEDPNCDFGGPHHTPLLEVVEGKYEDVVFYAVELPNFWQWGTGGEIKKVNVVKIDKDSVVERKELMLEKQKIEERLKEIDKKLKGE